MLKYNLKFFKKKVVQKLNSFIYIFRVYIAEATIKKSILQEILFLLENYRVNERASYDFYELWALVFLPYGFVLTGLDQAFVYDNNR